jgi:hypothetical protein
MTDAEGSVDFFTLPGMVFSGPSFGGDGSTASFGLSLSLQIKNDAPSLFIYFLSYFIKCLLC